MRGKYWISQGLLLFTRKLNAGRLNARLRRVVSLALQGGKLFLHVHVYSQRITSPQAMTLDTMANIPRSAFSRQQIQMIFWFLKANGVSRIPSANTLYKQNAVLHSMCGVRTLEYDGAFGHKYFINSLADIICQVRLPYSFACVLFSVFT